MQRIDLSGAAQELGRRGGLKSSGNMTAKARAFRAEHASLAALIKEERAVANFAREASRRPSILTGCDLLTYRGVQRSAREAGSITLKPFRTRIRHATNCFGVRLHDEMHCYNPRRNAL